MWRGYVKLWRKTEDSGLMQHPIAFTLFCDFLMTATKDPIKRLTSEGPIQLQPGQLISGRKKLAAKLGVGEQAIRNAVDFLVANGIATRVPLKDCTIFTIVNWKKYQVDSNQGSTPTATKVQPTPNQPPTTIQEDIELRELREPKEKTIQKTLAPPSAVSVQAAPPKSKEPNKDFQAFYAAYPRKKNPGDAEKAWDTYKPPLDQCFKALEWQKRSEDWTKDGGKWIPYPGSYIRAKAWLEEKPYNAKDAYVQSEEVRKLLKGA